MKRTELKARTPLKASRKPVKRRPISPASAEQRAKVRGVACRNCGAHGVHPAHVVDRSIGGCDDPLCVLPLCPGCHRAYDEYRLDILPLLDWVEQGHAAGHIGLVGAIERTTNAYWSAVERSAA
jgi:hypothetical protein